MLINVRLSTLYKYEVGKVVQAFETFSNSGNLNELKVLAPTHRIYRFSAILWLLETANFAGLALVYITSYWRE